MICGEKKQKNNNNTTQHSKKSHNGRILHEYVVSYPIKNTKFWRKTKRKEK